MPRKAQRVSTHEQLSLASFTIQPTRQEAIANVTWSYSKRSLFERCQRRYYYEYYGSTAALEDADPQHATLRRLKALVGRHERVGTLLHRGIATYLHRAQAGTPMPADDLIDWLVKIFRQDCAYSCADPDGAHPPGGPYPPVLLREYHDRQPDVEHLVAESEKLLREGAQAFLTAPVFAAFREAGMHPGALIEQHLRLPGFPCKVDGRLDLAYTDAGGVAIIDWKSGMSDGDGTDSLQLSAYALWARAHYQVAPDDMHISKAFLRGAEVVTFPVTEHFLDQGRARIIQDAERMAQVQHYGETGRVEAFTACEQIGICRSCPFQSACPEGSKLLHA
jgi:hypothetical protein